MMFGGGDASGSLPLANLNWLWKASKKEKGDRREEKKERWMER